MTSYSSKKITINKPLSYIYDKLSDLTHLEKLKDKMPEEYASKFNYKKDSIDFDIPNIGNVELNVKERADKHITFSLDKTPVKSDIKASFNEVETGKTEIQLSIDADIPFFLKPMIGNKIQEGLDKLTDTIQMALNKKENE